MTGQKGKGVRASADTLQSGRLVIVRSTITRTYLMIKIIDVDKLPSGHVLSKALIKLKKDHERGLLARHVVDKGDTVEIHTPMRKAS